METPHIDRVPAHQQQAFQTGPYDADYACVPDCRACEVLYSLRRFYDEFEETA